MNSGIPYFPLDVHLDDKFDLIEAEFGLTGFAVIVKLYQKIYGGQGYYCEWTNDVALLFGKKTGLGGNAVSEIVSASIRRGIFDKGLYEKYSILTSAGIQKRYFEAVSRRKEVPVKKSYLLVDADQILKNVNILSENVNISSENVNISEQSKGKKSKEEKRKAISPDGGTRKAKHKYGQYLHVLLTDEEYDRLGVEYANRDELVRYLDEYIEMKGYKAKSHYLCIKRWVCDAVREQQARQQRSQKRQVYEDDYDHDALERVTRGWMESEKNEGIRDNTDCT